MDVHSLPILHLCVYECVCRGRVWACGTSGEMPTKALNLSSELIKVMEQMVQTWSGHNETVSGGTSRTWQDSWGGGGSVRWLTSRQLPGVTLQSGQESKITTAWKLLKTVSAAVYFLRACARRIMQHLCCLPSSITLSWQVVFGKHQILSTCCQSRILSPNSNQHALTDTLPGKATAVK